MTLLRKITDDHIDTVNLSLWAEAEQEHGSKFKVPLEDNLYIGSYIRALYCLQKWDGNGSAVNFLNHHNIPHDVLIKITAEYCGIEIQEENISEVTEKRADKYGAFIRWASSHIFEQYTTDALVEQAGFSYPTTLKFLQESPVFRKIKKGLWEIRDAKADREIEKSF